jgi:hypothetical protein
MSVIVVFRGRLGNNLFQYAVGRLIAEHHGFALTYENLPESLPPSMMGVPTDCGPSATLEALHHHFRDAPLQIAGTRVETPVEAFEFNRGGPWHGHTIDLPAILADRTPRQIRLNGFFQRAEYLMPHLDRLRQWFQLTPAALPYVPGPRDVVVNIRRGTDFGVQDWTLGMAYYERVLAGLADLGRVYVCGTCVDDDVRAALAPYRPIYYDATPIEHFAFMQRFARIVLSNSTFAWWAALLSEAREIYAPRSADGKAFGFTGWQDVDLHMRDGRYREITETNVAHFAVSAVRFESPGPDASALDQDTHALLSWLQAERRPVSLAEIRARFDRMPSSRAVRQLIAAGLLEPASSYLET